VDSTKNEAVSPVMRRQAPPPHGPPHVSPPLHLRPPPLRLLQHLLPSSCHPPSFRALLTFNSGHATQPLARLATRQPHYIEHLL